MPEWESIVIDGRLELLRAFVAGALGAGGYEPTAAVLARDAGVEAPSLAARLRDLLASGQHAVLAPRPVGDLLAAATVRTGHAVGLRLIERQPLRAASFDIAVEVHARETANEIRAALAAAHDLEIEREVEREVTRAEYAGLELYGPVHDFVYRLRARVHGAPAAVLALRQRLAAIEAVHLSPLVLRSENAAR